MTYTHAHTTWARAHLGGALQADNDLVQRAQRLGRAHAADGELCLWQVRQEGEGRGQKLTWQCATSAGSSAAATCALADSATRAARTASSERVPCALR
jgi:hypothetical protein